MPTQKQKMLSGALYNAMDSELISERGHAHTLCHQFNALSPLASADRRRALLADLFHTDTDVQVTAPFQCDYGYNMRLGRNVFFNFGCVVLDVAPVSIGSNVLFGPAVQIYTATHPMDAAQRRAGLEYGQPVSIGDDVWVGGGAIICPGVTVGAGSVIGAGSVVTRDVPAGVFAAGNPCRVVRVR